MNKKIIFIAITLVITAGIGGYCALSNSGTETASAKSMGITSVFADSGKTLDEKLTDLYAKTVVESEPPEEETYIQEMAASVEMTADVENEDIEELDEQMYAIQNVNLRGGTAVTATALRTIQFSEQVHVTGISTDKQWYRVEDTQEGTGYVASSYLSYDKPTQNASAAQQGNPDGGGDLTATKPAPSGGNGGNGSGNSGGNGSGPSQSDLDALKAAIGNVGGGNTLPETPIANENSGSNHGITMAQ